MLPAQVTVVTPTIPGRQHFLAEALASVYAQQMPVQAAVVAWLRQDLTVSARARIAAARNFALRGVSTEWVAFIDDDNLWLDNHIAEHSRFFADADVIYAPSTPVDLGGGASVVFNSHDIPNMNRAEFLSVQKEMNLVDTNCLVRTECVLAIGGFEENWSTGFAPSGCRSEDHDFIYRLAVAGARFARVPVPTWTYRLHPGQNSRLRRSNEQALTYWAKRNGGANGDMSGVR